MIISLVWYDASSFPLNQQKSCGCFSLLNDVILTLTFMISNDVCRCYEQKKKL